MAETTRELTRLIASGDTEAFARFYDRWFTIAYAEARRACGGGRDESFCLDVVQEAMMRIIKSIRPLDTDAALHAWLRAVVRSCCYDMLRREHRRRRRERAASGGMGVSPVQDSPGRDGRATDERLAWLRQSLAELEPAQARLLSLRFRLGWTLQRIATFLGLKPGAVDGRLTRTLAALRARAPEDMRNGQ